MKRKKRRSRKFKAEDIVRIENKAIGIDGAYEWYGEVLPDLGRGELRFVKITYASHPIPKWSEGCVVRIPEDRLSALNPLSLIAEAGE